MLIFRVSLVLFAVLFAVPACGGDSDSGGTGSSATASEFAASYADLICAKLAPCCAAKGFDGSGTQCRALVAGSASSDKVDASAYDPAKGQKCLAEMKVALEGQDVCAQGTKIDDTGAPSCENVLPVKGGGKAAGEPCSEDDECAAISGAEVECYKTTQFTNGGSQQISYCRSFKPGKEGDGPCFWTIDGNSRSSSLSSDEQISQGVSCDLADGLYCAGGSSSGAPSKCKRILEDGVACSFSDRCKDTSFCSGGECMPRLAVGVSCAESSLACTESAYCDSKAKVCAEKKAEGKACEFNEECEGICNNGLCEASGSLEDFGFLLLCGPKK